MRRRLKSVLFPVLIAACYQDEANCSIVMEDMSLDMLVVFAEGNLGKKSLMLSAFGGDGLVEDAIKDMRNR